MAVLPKKFSPPRAGHEERIAALERYIKYLEEQIEHFATVTNEKIAEVKKNVNNEK